MYLLKSISRLSSLLLMAMAIFCCGEKPDATVSVTGVSISPSSISLAVGQSTRLSVIVEPSNATNQEISWISNNTDVVVVKDALVTAIKPGSAMVTATTRDGGKTSSCAVTVEASSVAVTGISLSKTSLELLEGASETLSAAITPDNATDKTVIWSSSDETVATVNSGKVTAVKAGTATITATTNDGQKKATCTVTVKAKTVSVTGVTLSKTSVEIKKGQSVTLSATVSPSNATNKSVSWSSSNEEVASVDGGVVNAKAVGETTITVMTADGGFKASCKVVVKPSDDEVSGEFPGAGWGDGNK